MVIHTMRCHTHCIWSYTAWSIVLDDCPVDLILLCLQVVPELFFNTVEVVSAIHETHALSLPDRPEKAQLREYAHLPQRAELAQLTQQLAAYAGNLKAFDR